MFNSEHHNLRLVRIKCSENDKVVLSFFDDDSNEVAEMLGYLNRSFFFLC